MTIGIFCPKDSVAASKIKFEAEKRGHNCKRLRISDLYVEVDSSELKVLHRKFDLSEIDIFIFRKFSSSESDLVAITTRYLKAQGKKVIDASSLATNNTFIDLSNLAFARLPILKRVFTTSLKSSRDILIEFNHPAVVKPLDLPSERYTFSEDWTESYDIVRSEKSKRYEFLEAFDNKFYIRVYVIGDNVIGSIKKTSIDPEKKLNLSSKTTNEIFELTPEIIDLCKKAASTAGYEICTIDLVETPEGFKIIELDRSPKFSTLNKLAGIRFEEKIVDYILG